MKKRVLALIAVLAMVFTGCGLSKTTDTSAGKSPEGDKSTETKATSKAPTSLSENATDEEINNFITAASSNPDKLIIKYASTSADLNGQSYLRAARKFLEVLKTELGDKVEIQYFMNSTFGGSADAVLGGLQNDTFEMTDWPLGSFAEFTNAFQPLDVPYLITSSEDAYKLLSGDAGKIMADKCIADTNIKPLYYGIIGMRQITNSKLEIKKPDDLKGLKIRVQNNPLHIAGMQELGCSPTAMAFSEVFTSLQQKVIDGQENPIETIDNFQYYEVQNYLTLTNHLCTAGTVAVNNDWYEGLSDEFKLAIDKASKQAAEYSLEDLSKSETVVLEELKGKITITQLTDEEVKAFQEKAKAAWPKLEERIGANYFEQVKKAASL